MDRPFIANIDADIAFDQRGWILQRDLDTNDSLHRTCTYAILQCLLGDRVKACKGLDAVLKFGQIADGRYLRHWSQHFPQAATVSRDQLVPLIIALGIIERQFPGPTVYERKVEQLWRMSWSRWLFAQNYRPMNYEKAPAFRQLKIPDWMGFHLSLLIRMRYRTQSSVLRMILTFTDLGLLFGTLLKLFPYRWSDHKRWIEKVTPDECDDFNEILTHLQAMAISPTYISELARWLYKTYRRPTYGTIKMGEPNHAMGAIVWYSRISSHGNPGLAELARRLVVFYM